MKKLAGVFIGFALLCCTSACWAAYVIFLKDGRTITTNEYWEEDGQIKTRQFGGVVGIAKTQVLSIEETDDVRTVVVKPPTEKKPEEANEKAEPPQPKGKAKKEKPGDVNNEEKSKKAENKKPSKEKNAVLKELDSLEEKFKRVDSMTADALLTFNRQLKNLRNKIIKAGLAGPYADQMVKIYNMITQVEEIYHKKKNQ